MSAMSQSSRVAANLRSDIVRPDILQVAPDMCSVANHMTENLLLWSPVVAQPILLVTTVHHAAPAVLGWCVESDSPGACEGFKIERQRLSVRLVHVGNSTDPPFLFLIIPLCCYRLTGLWTMA
jgi:hypothetical protein